MSHQSNDTRTRWPARLGSCTPAKTTATRQVQQKDQVCLWRTCNHRNCVSLPIHTEARYWLSEIKEASVITEAAKLSLKSWHINNPSHARGKADTPRLCSKVVFSFFLWERRWSAVADPLWSGRLRETRLRAEGMNEQDKDMESRNRAQGSGWLSKWLLP